MENQISIYDLEDLQKSMTRVQEDGKRFYQTPEGQRYPSVTTVTGLLTRDHIKLWRERVGAEEANRVSTQAAKRGTKMHSLFEQYLRQEEEILVYYKKQGTYNPQMIGEKFYKKTKCGKSNYYGSRGENKIYEKLFLNMIWNSFTDYLE